MGIVEKACKASLAGDTARWPEADPLLCRLWDEAPLVWRRFGHAVGGDTDDFVQDVFVRVLNRHSGQAISHLRSYLFQVARAVLIDRYRQRAARPLIADEPLAETQHPHDDLCPFRVAEARERLRAVEKALSALPRRTREIIIAARIEGVPVRRVAARHEISASAVEKHLHRGLRALNAALAPTDAGQDSAAAA